MKGFNSDKSRAWIELDMVALEHNVRVLCSMLPQNSGLMAVVKANAYGHGALTVAKKLECLGINSFGVACLDEALELRRGGIKGEVLILGYTNPSFKDTLTANRLSQTVVDYDHAAALNFGVTPLKVHLAIDTGMHRLGIAWNERESISRVFGMKGLNVEGVFSHLCTADSDKTKCVEFSLKQLTAFNELKRYLEEQGYGVKSHILASSGLMRYSPFAGELVRTGIALYGVMSREDELRDCPVELRPVLSLHSRIMLVRELDEGESLGYGLEYVSRGKHKIGVLGIGYGDGLPRSATGASVIIGDCVRPIIGRICMDQCFVDLTGLPDVKTGDEALLIGSSGQNSISACELAEASGTITNELLCRLGTRLKRMVK